MGEWHPLCRPKEMTGSGEVWPARWGKTRFLMGQPLKKGGEDDLKKRGEKNEI